MKIWILLCFVAFVTCDNGFDNSASPFKNTWNYIKRLHRANELPVDRVQGILNTDRNYFKNDILSPMLIERVSGTEGNRQVQQHIERLMTDLKWTITKDSFNDITPYGTKRFTNIIADQDPSAPRKLTLACHFDSKYFENFVFIAATDSAVPCAMLIDIATALNTSLWSSNKHPMLSLQLLFLDGEEAFQRWTNTDSIYGARHLAAKMENERIEVLREVTVSNLERMDLFCLLDLIGMSKPKFQSWFTETKTQFDSFVAIERRLASLGALSSSRGTHTYFTSASPRGHIEDDHIPFLHRKVPVLHMIAYPFPTVWHREGDNESALDYDTIDDLNKIFRVFVAEYLHLES